MMNRYKLIIGMRKQVPVWFVVLLLALTPTAIFATSVETTVAAGLTGSTQVPVSTEVLIYSIGLTEPVAGPPGNRCFSNVGGLGGGKLGVELTISDLSAATGLVAADFAGLNLYRSPGNATFDGGDVYIATNAVVNIGGLTTIDATLGGAAARKIAGPAEEFLLVTAVIAAGATPGHAFRVGAGTDHFGLEGVGPLGACASSDYNRGSAIVAADGNNIVIGAQSPTFISGVAGGGRGIPFGGEPVILLVLLGSGLYMIRRVSR
jgi:hypothetical protein